MANTATERAPLLQNDVEAGDADAGQFAGSKISDITGEIVKLVRNQVSLECEDWTWKKGIRTRFGAVEVEKGRVGAAPSCCSFGFRGAFGLPTRARGCLPMTSESVQRLSELLKSDFGQSSWRVLVSWKTTTVSDPGPRSRCLFLEISKQISPSHTRSKNRSYPTKKKAKAKLRPRYPRA